MNGAKKVFLKEVRDFARDKRVRSSAFRGPFVTIVLSLFVFGFLISTVGKPSSQKIDVVAAQGASSLASALKQGGIQVETVPSLAEGKARLTEGKTRLVIVAPVDLKVAAKSAQPVTFDEYYDPATEASGIAKGFMDKMFAGLNAEMVKQEFISLHVNPQLSERIRVSEHEVSQGKGGVNQFLLGILPYLIIMWAFYGGMGAVSELVAGEKEKFTLETLLITPVPRSQIALGKLSALALLCLLSPISALVGLVVTWSLHIPVMKPLFANGLGITPAAILEILGVLIPSVLLFASVLAAVSTRARNVRECQTQVTVVSMLVLMPALFSQFIGYTEFARATWIGFIPVLNSATAIRQALSGEFHPAMFGITTAVNLTLGCLAMMYTILLFKREDVLLRI